MALVATERAAGQARGKENVKAHASVTTKDMTAKEVILCVVLKCLFTFKSAYKRT